MSTDSAQQAIREANAALRDARDASNTGETVYYGDNGLMILLGALLLEVAQLRAELQAKNRA